MNANKQTLKRSDTASPGRTVPQAIESLDFSRLKYKYTQTAESEMTVQEWDTGEREYRRFLALKRLYPGASLVPSAQVDRIWHAHILDTRAYREDCEKVFGRFIDHYPYFGIYGEEDHADLQRTFEETVGLYEKHFGPYPKDGLASATRCKDHACHVPSSCACRAPGACK